MIDHPYKLQTEGQQRLRQLMREAERAQGLPALGLRRRTARLMRSLAERLEPEPAGTLFYRSGKVL